MPADAISHNDLMREEEEIEVAQPGQVVQSMRRQDDGRARSRFVSNMAAATTDEQPHGPQILPGSNTILYSLAKIADGTGRWDRAQIVTYDMESKQRRVLLTGGSDARYVSTGHLLYAVAGVVMAVPYRSRVRRSRVVVLGPACDPRVVRHEAAHVWLSVGVREDAALGAKR